jgi:hypothetical protein
MTSVGAFNDMMEQFINELVTTFPEEKGIKKYQASFEIVRKANPRKCVDSFMVAISPYASRLTAKDESVMTEDISFLTQVNIGKYWTPELSQTTKDAIWQYLQTLYMLGMTISSIPTETLNMIESVASQCADKIQSGEGQLDEKALMSSVSGLLGNLGGMFGNQSGK